MSEHNDQRNLVKLSDSKFTLEEPSQDVRGKDVYDVNGEQIGSVEDLYVDNEEQQVRYLNVGAGGFLGIGEKQFLIPIEAVTASSEDRVTIDQSREKVTGSPDFDPNVVPASDYQRGLYDYYGYPYPAWF